MRACSGAHGLGIGVLFLLAGQLGCPEETTPTSSAGDTADEVHCAVGPSTDEQRCIMGLVVARRVAPCQCSHHWSGGLVRSSLS